jgi:hypothetical protein
VTPDEYVFPGDYLINSIAEAEFKRMNDVLIAAFGDGQIFGF